MKYIIFRKQAEDICINEANYSIMHIELCINVLSYLELKHYLTS